MCATTGIIISVHSLKLSQTDPRLFCFSRALQHYAPGMLWLSLDLWKCFWISSNFQNNPCDPAGGLLSFYTQVWLVSLLVPILEFLWLWSRYSLIHDIPLYFRRNGDTDVQAMLWPTMHLLGTQLTMFVWASCLEKCLPACHEGLLGLSHSRIRTGSSYYPLPCFLASSTLCHYTCASPLHVYVLSFLYYDVFPLRFSRCFARCAARFLFRSTVPTPA